MNNTKLANLRGAERYDANPLHRYAKNKKSYNIFLDKLDLLTKLSKQALILYVHLVKNADTENKVYFNYAKQHDLLNYKSYVTAMKAVRELLHIKLIVKHEQEHTYFLNPKIIDKS